MILYYASTVHTLMRMTDVCYVPFRKVKQAVVEPQFVHQASLFSPKIEHKDKNQNTNSTEINVET